MPARSGAASTWGVGLPTSQMQVRKAEDDHTCGMAELPDNLGPSRVERVRVDLNEPKSTTPP